MEDLIYRILSLHMGRMLVDSFVAAMVHVYTRVAFPASTLMHSCVGVAVYGCINVAFWEYWEGFPAVVGKSGKEHEDSGQRTGLSTGAMCGYRSLGGSSCLWQGWLRRG